jgi:hypothetical protein
MFSLLVNLSKRSHYITYIIEHINVDRHEVMQCVCMPLRNPQGQISESPQKFHDVLDNCPLTPCGANWPVLTVYYMLELLVAEFS